MKKKNFTILQTIKIKDTVCMSISKRNIHAFSNAVYLFVIFSFIDIYIVFM